MPNARHDPDVGGTPWPPSETWASLAPEAPSLSSCRGALRGLPHHVARKVQHFAQARAMDEGDALAFLVRLGLQGAR